MSAISLKSITGITSITTPAGVDNQLTLHNNNTTEAVKLDIAGNLHFHNHLNITGVSTASNFKTGTSNLHNTGLNVQDLDVDGHTNLDNVSIAGVATATTFVGALTGTASGNPTLTSGANNRVVTATGANALTGEANFTYNGTQVDIAGTTDGVLNLDTTDSRGAFIRFGQGGSYHNMIGCADGLVAGPDKEDLGLRAADNMVFCTNGANERLRITSDGNIGFNRDSVNAGDSETETATSTPKRIVFNNDYSNVETDAALKIYLFNNNATRQGFTSGANFNLQYHSSGSSTHSKHTFYTQNVERLSITAGGFVGVNDSNPYTGLTINKVGDYWDTNGNSYIMPEGKILSSWRTAGDNDVDYWVGFVGGYQKTSPTVNIALQPNTSDFNQQSGMYIAGEATSNSTSDFTLGLIRNGNQGGRGTSGAQRAQKEELFRIKNNGNVGINTSTVDTKLHIVHPSANEDVIKIEAKPVTAGTGAKSKIIFQITQSNNQSARLAEIVSHAENGWGGQLSFNVKQTDSTPNNDTEEGLRITSSDSAATNMKMVVDAYLQLGGYNNTNESFVNLATLFSARDMAGSSLVSGQTDTISGYARRRITSDGSGTFFFGPYGAFPAGDYTALFRLKVSDRSGSSTIGYIDIIGNGIGIQGRNTAPRTGTGQSVNMSLQTNDFTASNTYQYFALDFSKSNSAAHIECRFLSYAANTDVYLDHILIMPRLNHGVEGVSGMFDY